MTPRLIRCQADLDEGAAALVAGCRHMARVHAVTGPPPLRLRAGGFAGLSRIITGQQLSVASADAIWGRVEALVRPFEPEPFLRKRVKTLRAAGLSAAKIETLRAAARAAVAGRLDFDRLADASDDRAVHEKLTEIKGIGPWTADIYAMFCLGRADAWAPGDLALRYAVQDAMRRTEAPSSAEMTALAEAWRPWRAVAARLLWSYYRVRNAGGGGAPA